MISTEHPNEHNTEHNTMNNMRQINGNSLKEPIHRKRFAHALTNHKYLSFFGIICVVMC